MPPFATVAVAVLAGFGVLQLLLLVYLYRREGTDRTAVEESKELIDGDVVYEDDRVNELLYARSTEEGTGDTTAVVCPNCAAENDPGFTFCRNCAAELSEE